MMFCCGSPSGLIQASTVDLCLTMRPYQDPPALQAVFSTSENDSLDSMEYEAITFPGGPDSKDSACNARDPSLSG